MIVALSNNFSPCVIMYAFFYFVYCVITYQAVEKTVHVFEQQDITSDFLWTLQTLLTMGETFFLTCTVSAY